MGKGKVEGLVVINILKKIEKRNCTMQTEAKTNLGVRAEITPSDGPETWESLAVVQSKSTKKCICFPQSIV